MPGAETNIRTAPRTMRLTTRGRPGQTARLVTAARFAPASSGPGRAGDVRAAQDRQPAASPRAWLGTGIAIALHGLLLLGLLLVWKDDASPQLARPVSVEFVSVATAARSQRVPLQPPSVVSEAEPLVAKPRQPIVPGATPAPQPAAEEPAAAEPAAAPAKPEAHDQQPAATPASEQHAAPANYAAEVMSRISAAKRYPTSSRARREEGTVRVSFALNRDGSVQGETLVTSSGHDALDKEALATVRRAAPYPPVPDDVLAPLELQVDVAFTLKK
jgi:protein TonB